MSDLGIAGLHQRAGAPSVRRQITRPGVPGDKEPTNSEYCWLFSKYSRNKKHMKKFFSAGVLAVLIFCQAARVAASSTPEEQADFLAGIPLPSGSVLAPLQESSSYKLHQKELNEKWAYCKKARYDAMQKWGEEHLKKEPSSRDVVRYLFGGPDFLNAFAFFPEARVMVLGGLEPIGEVPQPESLEPGSFPNSLEALRQALRTSLYCGYFITKEMGGQLHQGVFKGVLPVLYTHLALTGNRIESVEMVSPFGAPGVKIAYQRPGHPSQTLYYFKADLANGSGCQKFLSWLEGLGNGPAYLKAASYLLHNDSFSQTRAFLLNTSTLVVEDDSGIPFHDFNNGDWKIQVFGDYSSPLALFSGYKQQDFKAAYSTGANCGPITFGAGYHVLPKHANLLMATKGGKPATATVTTVATVTAAPVPVPVQKKTTAATVAAASAPAPVQKKTAAATVAAAPVPAPAQKKTAAATVAAAPTPAPAQKKTVAATVAAAPAPAPAQKKTAAATVAAAPSPAQKKVPQAAVQQTAKVEPAGQQKTVAQSDADPKERRKNLTALEDEERRIRDDKSLSREENKILLQAIWRKQLAVMGLPPDAAGKAPSRKKAAAPEKPAPIETAEPRPPTPPEATDT